MLTAVQEFVRRGVLVFTMLLLLSLTFVVLLAIVFRYIGQSLVWYDEIASVLLAWITYFGATLAAFQRSHICFNNILLSLNILLRKAVFLFCEAVVYIVFGIMAWAGYGVLELMEGETLISIPWIGISFTQSVIPITCLLFLIGMLTSFPRAWRRVIHGTDHENEYIEEEISRFELADPPSQKTK